MWMYNENFLYMSNTKCVKYNQFTTLLEEFKATTLVAMLPHNTWTTNIHCSQDHDNDYTPKHEECLQSICPDDSLQASLQTWAHNLRKFTGQRTENLIYLLDWVLAWLRAVMYCPSKLKQEIILKQLRLSKPIVYNNCTSFCKLLGFCSRVAEVAILLGYVAASVDTWFPPSVDYIPLKQWETITQWHGIIFQKNWNLMPFLICSWGSGSE